MLAKRSPFTDAQKAAQTILVLLPDCIGKDNQRAHSLIATGYNVIREDADKRAFENGLWDVFGKAATLDPDFVSQNIMSRSHGDHAVSAKFILIARAHPILPDFDGPTLFSAKTPKGGVTITPKPHFIAPFFSPYKDLKNVAAELFAGKISQADAAQRVSDITDNHCRVLGHAPEARF